MDVTKYHKLRTIEITYTPQTYQNNNEKCSSDCHEIDRNSGPFSGAGVNKVSVRNANNPMPTGHGEAGTKLLSPFEDGHYGSQ